MELTTKDGVYRAEQRDAFSFDQLRETGVLFMVNRVLLHPRGYALALEYGEGEKEPRGWNIVGNGKEIWSFYHNEEQVHFDAFEHLLEISPTTEFEAKI